jgi:hypothetical protein
MADNNGGQSGFGARLGRALLNLLKVLFFLGIFAGIVAGSWIAFREVRRSLDAATTSSAINERRIALLRSDVDNLMSDTTDQEAIDRVAARVATLESRFDDTAAEVNDELQRHDEQLDALRVQVGALITRTDTLTLALATSQRDMLALQGDLNETNRTVDDVGGALDSVAADLAALADQFAEVRGDAIEIAAMQQALTLFRAWEMMARARLSLAEGNAGAAATDIDAAQALVAAALTATADPGQLPLLADRLALVQTNLPENPLAAARDLETAWEILDRELARLTAGPAAAGVTPAPLATTVLTPTITPTLTPTPATSPTATLAPTTTPTTQP